MKKVFKLTDSGKAELEKELKELKNRRGEVAEKIAEARDFGDLSENAEYDAAREEQGLVETRIAEIENILHNAEIIKSDSKAGIQLGSTVELDNNGKKVSYTIVGPVEADPLNGRISNESPIGMALVGKKVGEQASIQTPKGAIIYNIAKVS